MHKLVLSMSLIFIFFSCFRAEQQENKVVRSKEAKYAYHHDYTTFFQYLKDSVKTINDEIEQLSFIRKRVAELIDMGIGENDFSKINPNWTEASGEEYYDIFYNNEATVECGGTSFFLRNVYRDLGYESYIYDMGCPSYYTHQVTLVKPKQNQQFYIQDAFHNVSYYERNNNHYLTFDEMLGILNRREDSLIVIQWDKYRYQFDFDTVGLHALLNKMGVDYSKMFKQNIFELSREDFVRESQSINNRLSKCLEENNLPDKSIYLFLLPQNHNLPETKKIVINNK